MKLKIAILAGDGIGPEVTNEAVAILRAVAEFGGHDFTFVPLLIGGVAITATGSPLPTATLDAASRVRRRPDGRGRRQQVQRPHPGQAPRGRPAPDPPGPRRLRQPAPRRSPTPRSVPTRRCAPRSPTAQTSSSSASCSAASTSARRAGGTATPAAPGGGEAINTMRYTKAEVTRVARVAFDLAAKRRKKVTSVDKANVLEVSQLWRATVTEVAKEYPAVTLEHQLVDSMAMHLMNIPRNFDVVLTENLFGDILSDEAAVITGSLGMLPSATIGGAVNLYEPVHGSAPDIAGTGKANPLGAILTAAMVLRHSANRSNRTPQAIEAAVAQVLAAGHRTADIARGGTAKDAPAQHLVSTAGDGQARPPGAGRIHRPPPIHARRVAPTVVILNGVKDPCICRRIKNEPLSPPTRRPPQSLREPARARPNPAASNFAAKEKPVREDVEWLWQYTPDKDNPDGRENDLVQDLRFRPFLDQFLTTPPNLLGPAHQRQVPLPRQHRARPPVCPRQDMGRREPLRRHLRLRRPLLSRARPPLARPQRRTPPRRLRRPRLDRPGRARHRPRRPVHPLALPRRAPHRRRARSLRPQQFRPHPARPARPHPLHLPLDRPTPRRLRHRPEHHPRHPRRPRRHPPRGRPLRPRRRPTLTAQITVAPGNKPAINRKS
jgi:3-isopropylmalate dehydrogenase